MSDLLIKRVGTGVAIATATDPFSFFEVHRLDRERWRATPEKPGIYLLYGLLDATPTAYIGMSTTSMRSRIASHHVSEKKAWFGVLFAIPLSASHCPSVEADLIKRVRDADVVTVANANSEGRFLGTDDVHIAPALDAITEALELLLGTDIFTRRDEPVTRIGATASEDSSSGRKRQWTMDEWMEEARRSGGPEYEEGVRDLAREWTRDNEDRRVGLGSGRTNTALFLMLDAGGDSYWPLAVYPGGVEVPFQWLAYRTATESEQFRREFMDRLNGVDGIDLDEARLNARPSFPTSVIASASSREEVIAVLNWFAHEVIRRLKMNAA